MLHSAHLYESHTATVHAMQRRSSFAFSASCKSTQACFLASSCCNASSSSGPAVGGIGLTASATATSCPQALGRRGATVAMGVFATCSTLLSVFTKIQRHTHSKLQPYEEPCCCNEL